MYRFWSKVSKPAPEECWEWTASFLNDGYGQFWFKRKTCRAHRMSWELTHGPIPLGKQVLHHCDNPSCVNPQHLFLGTHEDNMEDKHSKGRVCAGELHGASKLTWNEVHWIRFSSLSRAELAVILSVSTATIGKVIRNDYWKYDYV